MNATELKNQQVTELDCQINHLKCQAKMHPITRLLLALLGRVITLVMMGYIT